MTVTVKAVKTLSRKTFCREYRPCPTDCHPKNRLVHRVDALANEDGKLSMRGMKRPRAVPYELSIQDVHLLTARRTCLQRQRYV